jgi:hypothetical protein
VAWGRYDGASGTQLVQAAKVQYIGRLNLYPMYLMYVDESGDVGKVKSPTKNFILSAMVIHESSWLNVLDDLVTFRKYLKFAYDLRFKDEIHASDWISGSPVFAKPISRNLRLGIMKECLQWLDKRSDISVFSVKVDKAKCVDPFEFAWQALIQRFDNTLAHRNFPNAGIGDKGMIIADNTDGGKLTRLLRKMRRINYIPNNAQHGPGSTNLTLRAVIEDPAFRDSASSFFHQMVDVVAYFARQHFEANKYMRGKGGRHFYARYLSNVINKKVVTHPKNPCYIVEI